MAGAALLVLLSDVEGLYDAPPKENAQARLIPLVTQITPEIEAMAGAAGPPPPPRGLPTQKGAGQIAPPAGPPMGSAPGPRPPPPRPVGRARPSGSVPQ